MKTLHDLKDLAKELKKYNLAQIARETGLSYIGVHRIANGQRDPAFSSVLKLVNWLLEQEKENG